MPDVPQLPGTRTVTGVHESPSERARSRSRRQSHACAAVAVVSLLGTLVTAACGGSEKPAATANGVKGSRSETIEHQPCDASGGHVESLDTNGDGKPDIQRVKDASGHEVCRVVDLNHDGKPDLYEYFDQAGAVRRREFCYDDTGEVNTVETYQAGKLVERELDTTGHHRIDTWDWFDSNAAVDAKTGRPAHPSRRERDVRGGGIIDQWWTWNGDQLSIATDRNGDGLPDPGSVIVLGGNDAGAASSEGVPPPAPSAAPADDGGPTATSAAPSTDGGRP